MKLFETLFETNNNLSDFLDRNPEDKAMDELLFLLQGIIKTEYSLRSVFLGYNLLTRKIYEDPGWAFWSSVNIGHTATMGFEKKTLDSGFDQGYPLYLCYVALPIDHYDHLVEKSDILDWEFEEYLSKKIKATVVSIGAVKKNEFERCRTFKFLYEKEEYSSQHKSVTGIDLSNFEFLSSDHIRYENGEDNYGHQKGALRGIEIIAHDSIKDAYKVTIFNMVGKHPVWGNNFQMAPKRMKIVSQNSTKIELRGFGNDPMGASFSGYGITLHLNNTEVERVVLHLFDRNVDIEYFK